MLDLNFQWKPPVRNQSLECLTYSSVTCGLFDYTESWIKRMLIRSSVQTSFSFAVSATFASFFWAMPHRCGIRTEHSFICAAKSCKVGRQADLTTVLQPQAKILSPENGKRKGEAQRLAGMARRRTKCFIRAMLATNGRDPKATPLGPFHRSQILPTNLQRSIKRKHWKKKAIRRGEEKKGIPVPWTFIFGPR